MAWSRTRKVSGRRLIEGNLALSSGTTWYTCQSLSGRCPVLSYSINTAARTIELSSRSR